MKVAKLTVSAGWRFLLIPSVRLGGLIEAGIPLQFAGEQSEPVAVVAASSPARHVFQFAAWRLPGKRD